MLLLSVVLFAYVRLLGVFVAVLLLLLLLPTTALYV